MIISAVNAKGGVGKTTTTIFVATELARRGHHVRVIDLDRQGSALDWAERAEENGDPLPFEVEVSIPRQLPRIAGRLADGEIIVIDAPPGDETAIEAAIEISDFVILPTRATAADLTRVWEIRDALDDTPHAVLLTFVRRGTSAPEVTREILDAEQLMRFSTEIPLREDMHAAYGYTPIEMHGYDTITTEIMEQMQ